MYKEIDKWVAKFPKDQKQSAILQALMIAQKENDGNLTKELIAEVADYLEMPRIKAYEVATFYSMYSFKKVGKKKICVCTNISCMLRDSDKIVKHLKQKLKIDFNQVTEDGDFSLHEVECLGACVNAPVMQVNEDYHENLTPQKVDEILYGK